MGKLRRKTENQTLAKLRWPLRLTALGMLSEQFLRHFWPVLTALMLIIAALMFGLHNNLSIDVLWWLIVGALLGLLGGILYGCRKFRFPSRKDVENRLDETLSDRPISALTDAQAIGSGDSASRAIWQAHQRQMQDAVKNVRPVRPDLNLKARDPYALRYAALLAFIMALGFGSIVQIASIGEVANGRVAGDSTAPTGPNWEGWIEPPAYTGLPSLYLNDQTDGAFTAPAGSQISIRLYGDVGAHFVDQTIDPGREGPASDQVQDLTLRESGTLEIGGDGGASWQVTAVKDTPPEIAFVGDLSVEAAGVMTQEFSAKDDYAVRAAQATITLDLTALDRRYGLMVDPDPREVITIDLPLTIAGDRSDFTEALVEDFSKHPWANLPVTIVLTATDDSGQTGRVAEPLSVPLPGRRFFDPMARAVIELRRDFLWSRSNAKRTSQILRAITHRPDDVFDASSPYLMLRVALRRLETGIEAGFTDESQEEIAEALWQVALLFEDGSLSDALERLRQARERLSQAMRDGASDEEIAELMQQYREALEDYTRQLAQNPENSIDEPNDGQTQQLSQQDLQDMMDRIEELMQQGRMAEAEELLNQLQQMMENMRVTEGGDQQQGQSPGEQAMEGLSDTLREQQGLSDEAFRDLQEQFNPNSRAGESSGNRGRDGGAGEGQSHQGATGEGEGGENGGEEGDQSATAGQAQGEGESLADRQSALRDELSRQRESLPNMGGAEGEAAREALERAGRAMDNAEEALRNENLPDALDNQADAMEALREGMRQLSEALAQQNQENQGQQGDATSQSRNSNRDPLGRDPGSNGAAGTDDALLQGEDVYRRAKEILDTLRERSSDQERPTKELNYLRRLMDRF